MLAEFVTAIASLVRGADQIEIVHDEKLRKAFVRHGDEVHEERLPPELRSSRFFALDDFVRAVLDDVVCPLPEVFHDRDGAMAFVDRDNRKECIRLPYTRSDAWSKIVGLYTNPCSMTQKQIINFLRFDVAVPGVQNLMRILRKVDFSRKSDGQRSVEHGRESLGKSVEAAVQGIEEIPEEITVEVPIYNTPGLREVSLVSIRCGLLIDVEDERFSLRPLADELEKKSAQVQVKIGDLLVAAFANRQPPIPVYFGKGQA